MPQEDELDKGHEFMLTPLVQVSTCEKCGLLRLKTLSGSYYFVKFSEPFLHCNSPYREGVSRPDASNK